MQSGVAPIGKLRANIEREYHDIHLVGPAEKLAYPARVGVFPFRS
jgi:hypothetical protein